MPHPEQLSAVSPMEQQSPVDSHIDAGLDDYEIRIGQAVTELNEHPEAYANGEWPESFRSDLNRELRQELKTGQPSTHIVSRYVSLRGQAVRVYNSFARSKIESSQELAHFQTTLSDESLREAFFAEDEEGSLHRAVYDVLTDQSTSFGSIGAAVDFLQAMYGTEHPTDLLQPHVDDNANTLAMRHQLVNGNVLKYMYYAEVSSKWDRHDPPRYREQQAINREWMREIVLRATDIDDPEIADDYVFAASRNTGFDWEFSAADIIDKINSIGIQELATIRDFSRNCALNDYSPDQLERMARLAQGDPEEIAYLQEHDVIVILSNKMGDHNNILHTLPEQIDDAHKRTIIFEIQSLTDVYRSLQKLHALNILPSTIVPAAHSAPGQFIVSRKPDFEGQEHPIDIATIHTRTFVDKINKTLGSEKGFEGFAIDDMRGFARMVDEWMQPSRGIDDPDEDVGIKKVVFTSCNMGVEGTVTDLDDTGQELKLHKASVVSGLAESLKESGSSSRVKIYGAPDGIQLKPTSRGFHFSVSRQEISDLDDMQELLAAIEVELNNGIVTRSTVSEVELRNFDKQMVGAP